MSNWKPTTKNQKQYPHFDAPLSLAEMERIANDQTLVAQNAFLPFLRYEDTYQPFRPLGKKPKAREIRYGSRRDAAVFSCYRHQLSELYEEHLSELGISDCALAYRRIPVELGSPTGKSNIHHAKAAIDCIRKFETCCAITLDISSYFENVDHSRIKEVWCRLLRTSYLPEDHYAVFKAITKYAIVDAKAAYTALGYFGQKPSGVDGYLVPLKDMPKQLCSPKDFRDKICGKAAGYKNLVEKNPNTFGIPQGAPLSDLLANAYLIDFDVEMKAYAQSLGGFYMRYSDDILFVLPVREIEAGKVMEHVQARIETFGTQLRIKEEKCTIDMFSRSECGMHHDAIYPTGKNRNGLNYLGFRFDGERVYLRDTTISNFRRKITRAVNGEARDLVMRYPGKDLAYLEAQLNPDLIIERFGRVRGFGRDIDKSSWTFWTYVSRASKAFGNEARIYKQVSNYRDDIRKMIDKALVKYHARYSDK